MQPAQKKKYRAEAEDLENLAKTQEIAVDLTKKYLFQSIREMQAAGHSNLEIACVFIMFGYHLLRQGRSEEKAQDAFNILTYFAGRKIEDGQGKRNYQSFTDGKADK
jgi:hypothetical protein